jgi:D-beta-D-heptose 7-phosphate kinase/D-beta-D-heptose 1-phosphate adenosyltransferase
MFEATGIACETDRDAEAAVRSVQQSLPSDILLTRSEKGMSFYKMGEAAVHVPTVARDVFDVSGAGDTALAVLAAGLMVGADFLEVLRLANQAAGLVVAKLGTATITRNELMEAATETGEEAKTLSLEEAAALRRDWGRQKLAVGVANGCFDLLHPGHVSLLKRAASSCDRLIVALNSDSSVRRLKGRHRPVQDEMARANVIGAIKGVDAVVIFDQDTPLQVIQALQPDVIVKGADYVLKEVVGADIVTARGGRVVLAPLVPRQSTTSLVNRMEMPPAARVVKSVVN